jgi:hypothetical protein
MDRLQRQFGSVPPEPQSSRCWKCMADGPLVNGMRICEQCSAAMDTKITDKSCTDWIFTTVDLTGEHSQIFRQTSYANIKKRWGDYPDLIDDHFIRPATPEEIAANDLEISIYKAKTDRENTYYDLAWITVAAILGLAILELGWLSNHGGWHRWLLGPWCYAAVRAVFGIVRVAFKSFKWVLYQVSYTIGSGFADGRKN